MNKKHMGARSELIACAWLLENGWEVFRNVSQFGLVDLIGMKDGRTVYFDVKTCRAHPQKLSMAQQAMGVKPLYVFPDGGCLLEWEMAPPKIFTPNCRGCGNKFSTELSTQVYCSADCRNRHYKNPGLRLVKSNVA